jgi:hypothetical protein
MIEISLSFQYGLLLYHRKIKLKSINNVIAKRNMK